MESAKEKIQKITHSGHDDSSAHRTGLERDMDPKPTKTHLRGAGDGEESMPYRPPGKLTGKRALITGGDSGIGRSVAILFAMEGAKVAIVYLPHEEEDAQHTKAQVEKNGGEILLIASDLRMPSTARTSSPG